MVFLTKKNSEGTLISKSESMKTSENQENYYLNFYDSVHKNSRLAFEIKENKEGIYIDTLPF